VFNYSGILIIRQILLSAIDSNILNSLSLIMWYTKELQICTVSASFRLLITRATTRNTKGHAEIVQHGRRRSDAKGVFGYPKLNFSPYHIECLNLRSGY
jgi:hypothetical protein